MCFRKQSFAVNLHVLRDKKEPAPRNLTWLPRYGGHQRGNGDGDGDGGRGGSLGLAAAALHKSETLANGCCGASFVACVRVRKRKIE